MRHTVALPGVTVIVCFINELLNLMEKVHIICTLLEMLYNVLLYSYTTMCRVFEEACVIFTSEVPLQVFRNCSIVRNLLQIDQNTIIINDTSKPQLCLTMHHDLFNYT